jgi:hypothetical protein
MWSGLSSDKFTGLYCVDVRCEIDQLSETSYALPEALQAIAGLLTQFGQDNFRNLFNI